MSLLLQTIVTYIKENIIKKLQKLYSLPKKLMAGNKSPVLLLKKPFCISNLSPAHKILKALYSFIFSYCNVCISFLEKPFADVLHNRCS